MVVREGGNAGREDVTCATATWVVAPVRSATGALLAFSVSEANDAFVLGAPWFAELRTCLPMGRSTQLAHPSGVVQTPEFSRSPLEVAA